MFIGDVYHHALARLFARIRDADGRFRPERKTEYRALVGPCLDDAFAELSRQRGPFVGIVLEAYRGKLRSYLENLVDAEASLFPDLEIGPLEMEFELEYPDVEGESSSVDASTACRCRRREPSSSTTRRADCLPNSVAPDDEGAIAEAQIPLLPAARGGERSGDRRRKRSLAPVDPLGLAYLDRGRRAQGAGIRRLRLRR